MTNSLQMFGLIFSFLFWNYLLIGIPVLSIVSFGFYWFDKRQAKKEESRIPEATLHFWDAVGGWPGGFAAQKWIRHKTRKKSFQFLFWLTVFFHLSCVYVVYRTFFG